MNISELFAQHEGIFHPEQYADIVADCPINAIIKIRPDIYDLALIYFDKKLIEIKNAIPILKGKTEKLAFVSQEIDKIKAQKDQKHWVKFYDLLSLKWQEANRQAIILIGYYSDVKSDIEDPKKRGVLGILDAYPLSEQMKVNSDLIKQLDNIFKRCMVYQPDETGLVSEDVKQSLYRFSIYMHCQMEFHKKLCSIYSELETDTYLKPKEESADSNQTIDKDGNKKFTTAQQVLAIHYMLKYLGVKNVDNTAKARFAQLLTGKETGAKEIKNTNIYKLFGNPLKTDEKGLTTDLQFIRIFFENLGLSEIVAEINKELGI